MTDFSRIANEIAEQAPELRGDVAYAIGWALDMRGWSDAVDEARYARLEKLNEALGDTDAIETSLDQLLLHLVARSASAAQPTAAAVRRSLNEATIWGEDAEVA